MAVAERLKLETKEEILEACKSLGFHDTPTFNEFYNDRILNGVPNDDELTLLAPENVNLKAFWELCEELHFGSICGGVAKAEKKAEIEQCNFGNWIILTQMNMLGPLNIIAATAVRQYYPASPKMKMLEIGTGYGLMKQVLNPMWTHIGLDVARHGENNESILYDGHTIPDEILEQKDIFTVVSSNVFQHLSVGQRRGMYRQIADMFRRNGGGNFCVSNQTLQSDKYRFISHNGKSYINTFGMYTEIQNIVDIQKDLYDAGFDILVYSHRHDGYVSFSCQIAPPKKEIENEEVA